MYFRKAIGKEGEIIAENFLVKENFYIIEKNFKCKAGEVDIIAFDNKSRELVFCEVKLRSNNKFGRPAEAVGINKQKHIINVAKLYLMLKNVQNMPVRFDVIEVYLQGHEYKINHIPRAFMQKLNY